MAISPVFTMEQVPDLTFDSATYTVDENAGTVSVTVNASSAPMSSLTVNLITTNGTALGGRTDFTNPAVTFTFPSNRTSHSFTASIIDDLILENHENFTLTLQSCAGYTVGTLASTTVTITDNDTISVAMSATDGDADGNAVEGAGNSTGYRTITITLGQAPSSGQTIAVPLTVVGATVTTYYTFGLNGTNTGVSLNTSGTNSAQNPAVVFSSGASSATLRRTPVDNNNRTQPYVVIDYGTGPRAPTASGSFTLATPTGGPIGVGLVDDETGDIEVALDWALTPSGLSTGDEFRLIFITSETRDATSTDIDVYNAWAQGVIAKGGHASLLPYGGMASVVCSTMSTAARINTGMWSSGAHADGSTTASETGVQVYWLAAPPANQVADNYFDFYDGSWDGGNNQSARDTEESGASRTATGSYWTGTSNNGGVPSSGYIRYSNVNASVTSSGRTLSGGYEANSLSKSLLVMSPVLKVSSDPVISVMLPDQEGVSRTDAGEQKHEEATGSVVFPLSADKPLSTSLTVCLRVTESGGDRVTSTNEGIQTATLQSSGLTNGAGNYTLNWTDTAADDRDSSVTVELVAPGTVGCSGAGVYTVSTEDPSDKILIQDSESTRVSLTSSDPTMSEGDASDTATLTVSLSRRLYAGEIIAAPIALATSTSARLPGHATPDFAVSASGTGASVASVSAATPRVIFTGHDSNSVQTATVTLTPAANRSDRDTTDETITATLTSLGVTGLETVISGGMAAHSSDKTVSLMLNEPSEVSVAMAGSDGDADGNAVEGAGGATGYRTITITLGRALSGSETVTVPLTVQGATVTTDYTFVLYGTNSGVSLTTSGGTHTAQNPAVVFASGASSATLRLTPVDNNDRTQPYVVIDYGTGSRVPSSSGGVTLSTPSGGPIGIVLVDDETGDIEVQSSWGLKPSTVSDGAKFRLMYMTSEGGEVTSSDIEDYDEFVRIVGARGGHQDILPYIGFFKTFGSTRSTTATSQNVAGRGHVGMWSSGSNVWTDGSTSASSSGTPVHWLDGSKISDNYFDFCDSSWDNRWSSGTNHLKHEDSNAADGSKVWTGMANNCALHSNALGHSSDVSWGPGTRTASGGPLRKGQEANTNSNCFYGMSPEFKVETPPAHRYLRSPRDSRPRRATVRSPCPGTIPT